MKLLQNLFTFPAIICFCMMFFACNEEVVRMEECSPKSVGILEEGIIYPNSKNFKATRAGSFETDWENYQDITLANGSIISSPWNPNALGNFDVEIAQDVKKEKGWIILMHTFNQNPLNLDQSKFMIMYNKLSGQFKVFYYHDGNTLQHTSVCWNIGFVRPQGWLNSTTEVALPIDYKFENSTEYTWSSTMVGGEDSSKIQNGWCIFVVPSLAYDPTTSSNQILKLYNSALSTYIGTIVGSIEGDIKGKIITDGSSSPFSDLSKSLSNLSGNAAKTWVEKYCEKKGLSSIWNDVLSGGASALIKTGVQKILGGIFGFSGSTPTVQDVKLTMRSKANMDVKLQNPGISGAANRQFDFSDSALGINLGVWNLKENPTIYIHPVGVLSTAPMGIQSDENSYAFGTSGKFKADVVINPEIAQYVTSVNVTCDPIRYYITASKKGPEVLPQPLKTFTDFGSLGHSTDNYIKYDLKDPIYKDDDYEIYDNGLRSNVGFYGIWRKYGRNQAQIPIYKYMCATRDKDLCRQGFVYDATYNKVRVTVEIKYLYGGKPYTLTETRTFSPKFEWDPELVEKYNAYPTIGGVQNAAYSDYRLRYFDNGLYDQLVRNAGY